MALAGIGITAGAMFYAGGLIMFGSWCTSHGQHSHWNNDKIISSLNMFSFAFPVTLILAFAVLYLSTQTIGNAFAELTKNSLESIENYLGNYYG